VPSQHKHLPVAYRPPAGLRSRLLAYATATGRPVNAIITEALDAHLPPDGTPPGPEEPERMS
jgi:predicted DNA-binding protein